MQPHPARLRSARLSTGAAARRFEIHGHRGARGLAPENTLAGFARALEIGVSALELDVGITRDGVVVVHHDPTLNRDTTRDATGAWLPAGTQVALNTLTAAELAVLDVGAVRPGSALARRFEHQVPVDGERIPALSEVIALLERAGDARVRLNVEVKVDPHQPALTPAPERFADAVVAVLRACGAAHRANIQSFNWRVLARVQDRAPDIPVGHLSEQGERWDTIGGGGRGRSPWTAGIDADEHGGSVPRMVKAAGGRIWSPDYRNLDPAALAQAHALGLRVIVWTVNTPRDIARMIRLGVDGIISDYPDRVRVAAAAAGLALPEPAPVSR